MISLLAGCPQANDLNTPKIVQNFVLFMSQLSSKNGKFEHILRL
jgi:hypothetical protein